MTREVFLMSPPRPDWRVHGRANVFSQGAVAGAGSQVPAPARPETAPDAPAIPRGAALREWLALADAIVAAGGTIAVLPHTDDDTLTGMPYTAEAGMLGRAVSGVVSGVVSGGGSGTTEDAGDARVFLLPNVKPPHRRKEAAVIAQLVTSWGLKTHQVPVPWEGQGDVLEVGVPTSSNPEVRRRYVCTSGDGPHARTSFEAYPRVAEFLDGPSLHVRFRADPWFHGNTFLARFLDAKKVNAAIVVCEEALFPGELARIRAFAPDARIVPITREESLQYGTNALQVGTKVLAPTGAPQKLRELWTSLGLETVELALPVLFGKGGGAAVCLTNKLALTPEEVPAASRYEAVRDELLRDAAG